MENVIRLEILGLPENVGVARVALAAFAIQLDFTLTEIDEIKLCVSEAVSNSIIHAYPNQPGTITISGQIDNGCLTITVEDFGIGFDVSSLDNDKPPTDSTGTDSSETDRMGLGFVFMRSMSDEIIIESKTGEGTRIRMIKFPRKKESAQAVRNGI